MFTRLAGVSVFATVSACLPPPTPPDPIEVTDIAVDVEASHIDGAFTLAGGGFPAGPDEYGDVELRGAHAEDSLMLGQTSDQHYDAFVVNGSYDFRYRFGLGGAVVPANQIANIINNRAIAGNAAIPIDVGAVAISATFTLNGAPFPGSPYERAKFYLEAVGGGSLIPLGESHIASPPARVVPGTYHVLYAHQTGTLVPINRRSRVLQNVVLDTSQQLQVNVVASPLRVSFTLNGSPFPNSEYDDATFHLRDELTRMETEVLNSHDDPTSVFAIDGTYDVIYRHETAGQAINVSPINAAAVLIDNFLLNNGGAIAHDVKAVTIDASVTLNDGPFQDSEYEDGNILLYDPRTNTDTELGNTHDPFTDLVLIPGTYDVLFSHETGAQVPQNHRGIVAKDEAITNANLNVNVVGVQVGADITLNGSPFPNSEYEDANFFLSDLLGSEDILLGNSHDLDDDVSVMVLPGTYDLYYRHETGDAVPANGNHRILASQVLTTSTTLSANLETRRVRLAATLNDAPFPVDPSSSASIFARTREGDDVLMLETHGVQHTPLLIRGDYELYYMHTTGLDVPRNPWTKVDEVAVN